MFRRYSLITFSRCHIYKASGRHRLDRREEDLVMEKHDSGVGDLKCEVVEYVKLKNSARNGMCNFFFVVLKIFPEVGIYKRKQELDQESGQEKKKEGTLSTKKAIKKKR